MSSGVGYGLEHGGAGQRRWLAPLSALVVSLAIAGPFFGGCGNSQTSPTGPGAVVDSLPLNSTPEGLLQRFKAALEHKNRQAVLDLLTANYRFNFSSLDDPSLVAQYPEGWLASDEDSVLLHLFGGFRSAASGETLFAAQSIVIGSITATALDDPSHPDSMAYYKIGKFTAVIDVPTFYSGDFVEFQLTGSQRLCLVRGNAAVLRVDQPASSDRWYISRWDDSPQNSPKVVNPTTNPGGFSTWGRVKVLYRR